MAKICPPDSTISALMMASVGKRNGRIFARFGLDVDHAESRTRSASHHARAPRFRHRLAGCEPQWKIKSDLPRSPPGRGRVGGKPFSAALRRSGRIHARAVVLDGYDDMVSLGKAFSRTPRFRLVSLSGHRGFDARGRWRCG
jgi:hypothetical protein